MNAQVIFLLLVAERMAQVRVRLLAKVQLQYRPQGRDHCWLWTGSGDGRYGHMYFLGVKWKTHILAYLLWKKVRIPRGHVLLHACDTTNCCCPWHLSPGSHTANMRDMCEKGRHGNGGGLKASVVRRIRLLATRGVAYAEIARRVGCADTTVGRIVRREIRA